MAASSALLTDIASVITNGPNATTTANSIAQGGPIMDYVGNSKLVQLKLGEAEVLLAQVVTDTDASDSTNLTLLNGVKAALNGTGSPSTTLVADIGTALTNGPNAASKAKAIVHTGPIMDYVGNLSGVQLKLNEAKVLLNALDSVTASSDATNKTLIANLKLALV